VIGRKTNTILTTGQATGAEIHLTGVAKQLT